MIRYTSASRSPRTPVLYDTFLSVDFAKAASNVKAYHSPDAVNMIRDEYGKVRRRMGYHTVEAYTGRIWGVTRYKGKLAVHAGTKLYYDGAEVYNAMGENVTQVRHADGKLWLLDGKALLCFDGTTCAPVEGKVPLVMIAGTPAGGGTQFEQVNLLSDKWTQSYAGDGTSKDYYLMFQNLDASAVEVKKARLSGGALVWDTLTEGEDFTVDRAAGCVTFASAPSEPVVAQEDNVIITASKDRSEQRSRIFSCRSARGFGINGYDNQWFVTGNAEYPNFIWWSGIGDMTYFGDLQYAVLGQDDSAVMGLSAMSTQLVAHKDAASGQSYLLSVFAAELNALTVPQVRVERVIGGSGCIARHACAQFGEPLFLSELGVQAITYRDLTGTEMETMRGERIARRLLSEPGVEDAVAAVYKYVYLVAVNSHVYVLDRLNPQGEANVLSSAYQYNAFYWEHVPAVCFFADGNTLYFGTEDGRVCAFYTDEADPASYNDDGETYAWRWEFPEYVGKLFYRSKAVKYLALRAKAYLRTTVTVDVRVEGQWYEVLTDGASFGYLDLNDLDLSKLNLSTDATPKKTARKHLERHLDKLAFRVRGDALNEPFGLYSFAFEVSERGRHKG